MTFNQYQLTPLAFTAAHSISKDGLWVPLFAGSRGRLEFSCDLIFIWQDELYWKEAPTEREVEITAVPYCGWDNRTPGRVPEIGIQNEHDSHHSESG
jgi:hypothetical protein